VSQGKTGASVSDPVRILLDAKRKELQNPKHDGFGGGVDTDEERKQIRKEKASLARQQAIQVRW